VMLKTPTGRPTERARSLETPNADYRTSDGTGNITTGPGIYHRFRWDDGAALATADFSPARGRYIHLGRRQRQPGKPVSRHHSLCLNGVRPSAVFCRGYYARTAMTAWNWRGGKLTKAWTFDTYNKCRVEKL